MATLPTCALCKIPERVLQSVIKNKKQFLIYSIFIILLIEWFSLIYLKGFHKTTQIVTDYYVAKMYPFLSQLALFVMFFSIFLWRDRLHFCFRKTATTFYLSCYYLFNSISVLLCLNASIYYELVSYGFLAIASLVFFVSFLKTVE